MKGGEERTPEKQVGRSQGSAVKTVVRHQFTCASGKKVWSQWEDNLLKEAVERRGAREWTIIASQFDHRNGKQCRERWHNHLRNGVKKEEWSLEEEWILALGVEAHGHRWSVISKCLQGRSDNNIKNHWNCKMKPKKNMFEQRIKQFLETQNWKSLTTVEINLLNIIRKNVRNRELPRISHASTIKIYNVMKKMLTQFYEESKKILQDK